MRLSLENTRLTAPKVRSEHNVDEINTVQRRLCNKGLYGLHPAKKPWISKKMLQPDLNLQKNT